MNQFLDLSQFVDPEPCEWREGPLKYQSFTISFSPDLPQKDLHWGTGNNQTFQGLLYTGSELALILEDPKKHCGPPGKVGGLWESQINGILVDSDSQQVHWVPELILFLTQSQNI